MHLTQLGPDALASYDVVLVGTSFAALPLLESLRPQARVLLIEGGEPTERDEMRALTETEEYGHFSDGYWAQHWVRAVGGTSVRWSGVIAALDPDDLAGGRGRPAWPIDRADLAPYYRQAAAWIGRPPGVAGEALPWLTPWLTRPLSHDAPVRLLDRALALSGGDGVDLLARHTVVRAASARRDCVDGLVVTGPDRVTRTLPLRPSQFVVLACGALGNAQILLQPADHGRPVGNESGLVGRFLMEHPHVVSGDVLVRRDQLPGLPPEFGPGLPAFRLQPDVMAREDLLGCSLAIQGPLPMAPEVVDVAEHFASTWGTALEYAEVFARAEQEPSPTNRVEIVGETTWAGSHRLRAHCSFSSRDLRSIEVSTRRFGADLLARRLGVVRLHNRRIYRDTTGGGHTMGTTRMGVGPGESVCDASQRVHGYANLYLSGSSVFPSAGAVNPTLTIVALSLRLGAHLARRLREA